MISLDKEQVKRLHRALIDKTGGSDGILDEGLLESALANPFQTFVGRKFPKIINSLYKTIIY